MNHILAAFAAALPVPNPLDEARAGLPILWRIVDAALRRWAPMRLDVLGRKTAAAGLRALPAIVDLETARAALLGAVAAGVDDDRPGWTLRMTIDLAVKVRDLRVTGPRQIDDAVLFAARCAEDAGPEAIADARRLVDELAGCFRG